MLFSAARLLSEDSVCRSANQRSQIVPFVAYKISFSFANIFPTSPSSKSPPATTFLSSLLSSEDRRSNVYFGLEDYLSISLAFYLKPFNTVRQFSDLMSPPQRQRRDFNKFPTTQLFFLGKLAVSLSSKDLVLTLFQPSSESPSRLL